MIFKKLKSTIESKRGLKNPLWERLVIAKDFIWELAVENKRVIKKLFDNNKYRTIGVNTKSLPKKRHTSGLINLYIHTHIPKTGGTTFNTYLSNIFDGRFDHFHGKFIHVYPRPNTEQIEDFIYSNIGMRAVASHAFNILLPYQTTPRRIVALAFVRDPIDRFFSGYFYWRHREGVDCPEKMLLLKEYIEFKIRTIKSNQTRFDGHLSHLVVYENDLAFDYIKELVRNEHLYLFSTYHMNDAVKLLCKKFPHDFKKIPLKRENASVKDQKVTERLRNMISPYISPYDWKLLELAEKRNV